jgi:uncharacterized phiE125 gp8 family phage protein
MNKKIITPPSVLAVTLDDARLALRIDGNDLDVLITAWLNGIVDHAEHITGRSIMMQTKQASLDVFPWGGIDLQDVPIISVTSVQYIDVSGALQTMPSTDYWVDNGELSSFIVPKSSWPSTAAQPNAVVVQYVSGYGNTAADVPPAIRSYILAKLTEQFDASNKTDKASVQSSFIDSLLDRYRVWT